MKKDSFLRRVVLLCLGLVVLTVWEFSDSWAQRGAVPREILRDYRKGVKKLQDGDRKILDASAKLMKVVAKFHLTSEDLAGIVSGKDQSLSNLLDRDGGLYAAEGGAYRCPELESARSAYALAKRHYESADRFLSNAIKADPQFVDAYILKGIALVRLGGSEDAVKSIREAKQIGYSNLKVLNYKNLAKVLKGEVNIERVLAIEKALMKEIGAKPVDTLAPEEAGYRLSFRPSGVVFAMEEMEVAAAEEKAEAEALARKQAEEERLAKEAEIRGDEAYRQGRIAEAIEIWRRIPVVYRPFEKVAEAMKQERLAKEREEELVRRIAEGDDLFAQGRYAEAKALWEEIPEDHRPLDKIAEARRLLEQREAEELAEKKAEEERSAEEQAEAERQAKEQAKADSLARKQTEEERLAGDAEIRGDEAYSQGRLAEAIEIWKGMPEAYRPFEKIREAEAKWEAERKAEEERSAEEQAEAERQAKEQAKADSLAGKQTEEERLAGDAEIRGDEAYSQGRIADAIEIWKGMPEAYRPFEKIQEAEAKLEEEKERKRWAERVEEGDLLYGREDFAEAVKVWKAIPETYRPFDKIERVEAQLAEARRKRVREEAEEEKIAEEQIKEEGPAERPVVVDSTKEASRAFELGKRALRDVENLRGEAMRMLDSRLRVNKVTRRKLRELFGKEQVQLGEFFHRLEEEYQDRSFNEVVGELRKARKKLGRAYENFQNAVKFDPDFLDAYVMKIIICLNMDWNVEIIRTYEAIKDEPLSDLRKLDLLPSMEGNRIGGDPIKDVIFEIAKVYHENRDLVEEIQTLEESKASPGRAQARRVEKKPLGKEVEPTSAEAPREEAVEIIKQFVEERDRLLKQKQEGLNRRSEEYVRLDNIRMIDQFALAEFYKVIGWKTSAERVFKEAERKVVRIFGRPEYAMAEERIRALNREIEGMETMVSVDFNVDEAFVLNWKTRAKVTFLRGEDSFKTPVSVEDLVVSTIPGMRNDVRSRKAYTSGLITGESIPLPAGMYSAIVEIPTIPIPTQDQIPFEFLHVYSEGTMKEILNPSYHLEIQGGGGTRTIDLIEGRYTRVGGVFVDNEGKRVTFPPGVCKAYVEIVGRNYYTGSRFGLSINATEAPEPWGLEKIAKAGLGAMLFVFFLI